MMEKGTVTLVSVRGRVCTFKPNYGFQYWRNSRALFRDARYMASGVQNYGHQVIRGGCEWNVSVADAMDRKYVQ